MHAHPLKKKWKGRKRRKRREPESPVGFELAAAFLQVNSAYHTPYYSKYSPLLSKVGGAEKAMSTVLSHDDDIHNPTMVL